MIDDRQNFIATTEHRPPARILYHASFTPDLRRRVKEHVGTENVGEYYRFARRQSVGIRRPDHISPPDYSRYYADDDLPENTVITASGTARVPGDYYHFFRYVSPLRNARTLKEIEDYPIEDITGWDSSHMSEVVRKAHADGRYVVGGVGHIFETAWQIRGMQQFIMDTIVQPAWAECLMERLAAQARVRATAAARAGADLIHCGDDVGTQTGMMVSPELWRQLFHPHWRKIWHEVKAINPDTRIWYHSDGCIAPIVGDLIEAGVDILNPIQPECLDENELYRKYGSRITFHGCMGTQSTMPFGTPDDVRDRVKALVEKFGRTGGLILSPTHVLEPEVPLENIDAFAEACREYGER